MVEKYYVDTAIWRDLYENRTDLHLHLGELAFTFFKQVRINRDKILYSEWILEELSQSYDHQIITSLFSDLDDFLELVPITPKHVKEVFILSRAVNMSLGDALHAVLARDNNAILVTRDHHFNRLKTIMRIKKPEELL